MHKKYIDRVILVIIIIFIAWISFIPEPLKYQYNTCVKLSLFIVLLLSLYKHRFNLNSYFINKNGIFWTYLILFSLNIWFAAHRSVAHEYYSDFVITAVPIYLLLTNEVNSKNIKKILYSLCVCAGLVSIIGFLEMLLGANLIYERFVDNYYYGRFIVQARMMSTLIHPNVLGSYLIICVPLAYYFYRHEERNILRYLNLLIFLLIVSAVFLTYSRGTWFALLLMLSTWFLFKRRFKWVFFGWFIFFLFIILSSMPFIAENIRYRFGINYLWAYLSHSHRTAAYFVTGNMLKYHPFVGIGLNHYRMLFNQYSNIRLPHEVMIPDSVYLMHLAETGILGFSGFLLFLVNLIRKSLSYYKSLRGDRKEIRFVIFIGFLGLLFNMASYDAFLWKTPFYLFWLFAGIIAGLSKSRNMNPVS